MAKKELEFVSKTDFGDFQKSVEATQGRMLDILEELSKPKSVNPQVGATVQAAKEANAVTETTVQEDYLPPQYKKIMDKHFDPTDGFEGFLKFPSDEEGSQSAITFTVIVPEKFTNRTDAHKKYYKTDIRMVALRPENIIRGIDSWCNKVAKNLHYNKLLKTK